MHYDPIMCMMVDDIGNKIMNDSIKTCDSNYDEVKKIYNVLGKALQNSSNADKMLRYISEAQGMLLKLATKLK